MRGWLNLAGRLPCFQPKARRSLCGGVVRKYQKLFRAIGAAFAFVLVPAVFYAGLLDNTYVNRPREPRHELGLTVPHQVKGITTYITTSEQRFLTWLTRVEIVSGIGVLVSLVLSGDVLRRLRGN
jgi:hypothetical protein